MSNNIPFRQTRFVGIMVLALMLCYARTVEANDTCAIANGVQACEDNDSSGVNLTAPSPPLPDSFLNVPIPGTSNGAGGVGQVNSYSDLAMSGSNADGIFVTSRTTGRLL